MIKCNNLKSVNKLDQSNERQLRSRKTQIQHQKFFFLSACFVDSNLWSQEYSQRNAPATSATSASNPTTLASGTSIPLMDLEAPPTEETPIKQRPPNKYHCKAKRVGKVGRGAPLRLTNPECAGGMVRCEDLRNLRSIVIGYPQLSRNSWCFIITYEWFIAVDSNDM